MTVTELWLDRGFLSEDGASQATLQRLQEVGVVCNSAVVMHTKESSSSTDSVAPEAPRTVGNASDVALLNYFEATCSLSATRKAAPVIVEIPFNSVNKWQLVVVRRTGADHNLTMMVKGAPEIVLTKCTLYMQQASG